MVYIFSGQGDMWHFDCGLIIINITKKTIFSINNKLQYSFAWERYNTICIHFKKLPIKTIPFLVYLWKLELHFLF